MRSYLYDTCDINMVYNILNINIAIDTMLAQLLFYNLYDSNECLQNIHKK